MNLAKKYFLFMSISFILYRLVRKHYWKSQEWQRCLWRERWWRENLQLMAWWHGHVVRSIWLHFTGSQRWQNRVLPAWRSFSQLDVKDRGWLLGPPCPAELENPGFLGIRQEEQWICTELWALPWDLVVARCNMSAWSCCLHHARELRDFTRPKRLRKWQKRCFGHTLPSFSLAQRKLAFRPFFKVQYRSKLLAKRDDSHFHSYFSSISVVLPIYVQKKPPRPYCSCLGSGHICMSKTHLEN